MISPEVRPYFRTIQFNKIGVFKDVEEKIKTDVKESESEINTRKKEAKKKGET